MIRRFHFVRRVITRPADAGDEAHESVTPQEFARREFALQWQAHGLSYGIPADAIGRGAVAVANVSRTVIAEAASRFQVRVIEVTAPADVLAARLASRGRESATDVASRLARSVTLPSHVMVDTVMNDASARRRCGALPCSPQPRSFRRRWMTKGAPGAGCTNRQMSVTRRGMATACDTWASAAGW